MSGQHPAAHDHDAPNAGFDREIALGVLWKSAAALLLTTAVAMGAMWLMLRSFSTEAVRQDRPPSPLAEANRVSEPPAPRLQEAAEVELGAFRGDQATRLASYGWNDRARGTVHIPIDKAMELLLADAQRLSPGATAPVTATPGEQP